MPWFCYEMTYAGHFLELMISQLSNSDSAVVEDTAEWGKGEGGIVGLEVLSWGIFWTFRRRGPGAAGKAGLLLRREDWAGSRCWESLVLCMVFLNESVESGKAKARGSALGSTGRTREFSDGHRRDNWGRVQESQVYAQPETSKGNKNSRKPSFNSH